MRERELPVAPSSKRQESVARQLRMSEGAGRQVKAAAANEDMLQRAYSPRRYGGGAARGQR